MFIIKCTTERDTCCNTPARCTVLCGNRAGQMPETVSKCKSSSVASPSSAQTRAHLGCRSSQCFCRQHPFFHNLHAQLVSSEIVPFHGPLPYKLARLKMQRQTASKINMFFVFWVPHHFFATTFHMLMGTKFSVGSVSALRLRLKLNRLQTELQSVL